MTHYLVVCCPLLFTVAGRKAHDGAVACRRVRPIVLIMLCFSLVAAGCLGEPAPASDPADTSNDDDGATGMSDVPRLCTSSLDETVSAARPKWVLDTNMGSIRISLLCDLAPETSQNFVDLTEKGYFDGTKFHRVIADFMNQGGDPLSKDDSQADAWGTGGPGYTIADEFACSDGSITNALPADCELAIKHDKPGILSMANTGRPHTGGSQFFLTAVPTPWLDGKHAIFGQAADDASVAVIQAINGVDTDGHDRPLEPVVLQTATMVWE